jgi:hypothetical protein
MPKIIYHDSDGVDKTIVLSSDPVMIGRATECTIQTQDAMVSRRHARIFWDGNYFIEDLGSSNGVYIGNEKVQRAPIRPGDTVTCGSLVLRLVPDTLSSRPQAPAPVGPPMAPPPMAPPMAPSMGAPPMAPSMSAPPMAPPLMAPPMGAPPMAPSMGAPPMAPSMSAPVPTQQVSPVRSVPDPQLLAELEREKRGRAEAESALLQAETRAKAAETRATELEAAGRDTALLKRKVDQLTADLRRMRGGKDPLPDSTSAEGDAALKIAEAERDRAQRRVTELEAELARASSQPKAVADDGESARLKRQVDQLNAELRRMRAGQAPDAAADSARIAELTAQVARAEAERDAARAATAKAPAAARPDPAAADAAVALSDSLAELRSSLRAATDEASMLTSPSESVQVVSDSLRAATEQIEAAREHLRTLGKLLGVA